MDDQTNLLDQSDHESLTYDVPDEALERAASIESVRGVATPDPSTGFYGSLCCRK
jgi:hypothetical protein